MAKIEEIESELAEATKERDALEAEMGELLIAGGDKAKGSALNKKLKAAQARVDELVASHAAVRKALDAAAAREQAKAEREAQEALEKRVKDAEADHGEVLKRAAAADAAFEALNQALSDLGAACDQFCDNYGSLSLNRSRVSVMRNRGWNGQVLANFRNHGERHFRNFLNQQGLRPAGSGILKTVESMMPTFAEIMTPRKRG
jgi:chromosome segregation ATPase